MYDYVMVYKHKMAKALSLIPKRKVIAKKFKNITFTAVISAKKTI